MPPPDLPQHPAPAMEDQVLPPLTELQGHASFFDRDNDGVIWPTDTYNGMRALGFGILLSVFGMLVIHNGLSLPCNNWWPDPLLRIRIKHVHRAIHGSDSQSYNKRGELSLPTFDQNFLFYSPPPHTSLSFWEGVRMIRGNANPFDPFGWTAAALEWLGLYLLVWPADGRVGKEEVRGCLDGSLFYKIAQKEEERNKTGVPALKRENKLGKEL